MLKKKDILGVRFEMYGLSSLFQVFLVDGKQLTYTRSDLPRCVYRYLEGCRIYKQGVKDGMSIDILFPASIINHKFEFQVPDYYSCPALFDLDYEY